MLIYEMAGPKSVYLYIPLLYCKRVTLHALEFISQKLVILTRNIDAFFLKKKYKKEEERNIMMMDIHIAIIIMPLIAH
jgi:hypothetical protein